MYKCRVDFYDMFTFSTASRVKYLRVESEVAKRLRTIADGKKAVGNVCGIPCVVVVVSTFF